LSRLWPSRPGELHPEPLMDPSLSLSTHTARTTQRRLPPPIKTLEFLRWPVDPADPDAGDLLPSAEITPTPQYYGAVRSWLAHRCFRPRGATACAFSLNRANQVLKFGTEARIGFTLPQHRTAGPVNRFSAMLLPDQSAESGFDVVFELSMRHQQFACARLPNPHMT
jgi:hypothetical protein